MQTHGDESHDQEFVKRIFESNPSKPEFMKDLRTRAEAAIQAKASQIASGMPGEFPVAAWTAENGMVITQLHEDPQGILRISVGGLIEAGHYCSFRGDRAKCVHLLKCALAALENPPA